MQWSSSTGEPVIYWLIYIVLTLILTICGHKISSLRVKLKQIKIAIFAGIFYSLVEGLRWLRGADYYHYYSDLAFNFNSIFSTQDPEILYKLWVNLFYHSGFPPELGFVIYSMLFIFGVLLIFLEYPRAAKWGLPMIFLLLNTITENIIRQYIAISFILLAYFFYLKGHQKKMIAMLCIVPFIHTSGMIAVLLFLIFAYVPIKLKSPVILVAIYVAAYFLWSPKWLDNIVPYLQLISLNGNDKMQAYLDYSDRWFTTEGINGENYASSFLLTLSTIVVYSSAIYYGFKACLKEHKMQVIFYFSYFGILIKVLSSGIEIISRIADWTYWMVPILMGLALTESSFLRKKTISVIVGISYFLYFIYYGIIVSMRELPYAGCGFIWDK